MTDEQDRKDYDDYLEYLKHTSQAPAAPTVMASPTKSPQTPTIEQIEARNPLLSKIESGIASGGAGEIAAPLGGLVQSGLKGLSKFLAPAAERSAVLSQVKNEAGLGPYIADKMRQAGQAFDDSQIAPKMADQYKAAAGKFVDVDPATLHDIHPDINKILNTYKADPVTGKISMPMEDALDLRSSLNSQTKFKQGGTYSTADAVRTARSKASDAGNAIRSSISEVDPGISESSDALRQNYNLKNSVMRGADTNPISSVRAPEYTDKASKLSQFDDAAGSDLRGLGRNIDTAKDRLQAFTMKGLKKLFTIGAPKEAFDLATTPIARAYDASAELASPALNKASNSTVATTAAQLALQNLLQGRNKQ